MKIYNQKSYWAHSDIALDGLPIKIIIEWLTNYLWREGSISKLAITIDKGKPHKSEDLQ